MKWHGTRRRRLALTGVAVLLVALAAALGARVGSVSEPALPDCPAAPAIVIDPGHGGIDGGANIPGMLEKEIVLDVALQTKQMLEERHVPVVMTRATDSDLGGNYDGGRLRRDLNYRIKVANNCRTALMLSLHVNSTVNTQERGMLILYQPTRAGRDAAYFFDDVLRRWPLHTRREDPIARKDLAVLKTKAPSLLVEMGFISNQADRELLGDGAYRKRIAQALTSACAAIYHQWVKQGNR